jgi:TonB family protein
MVEQPSFERPEPPHYLNSGPADLAPAFREFVADDHPAEFSLNFKPEPAAVDTAAPFDNPVPPATTMTLSPELSPRGLPDAVTPPSWPRNDVIGPTTIQVLVDQGGNVGSAIVLKSSGDSEADQQALQLASNMRFAPAPQPTVGGITFHWHTVPANASPSKVP